MPHLQSAVVTVVLGLLMALIQAPAYALDPNNPKPTATPAAPMAKELFYFTGNIPTDGSTGRTVNLQKLDSDGQYRTVNSRVSEADGDYSIPWRMTATSRFQVTSAPTDTLDEVRSWSNRVEVASQYAKLWSVERVCNPSNNDCEPYAKATGYVKPLRLGRTVYLQGLTSQGWKTFSGVKGTTQANGWFETNKFYIGGWAQWSVRKLRIVAGSYNHSTGVVSAPLSFMPGPAKLGDNVLRVDVDGGSFPSKKGVEYKGYATLIEQGKALPTITKARLDNFAVRGSTTSGYPKKPYNFRFDEDAFEALPDDVTVFGMDKDRRWTLLAMYADQSYVRDKTALDLGRKLAAKGGMSWNPDSRYVELFVNSVYMGAYLMTEKVDIDGDKVNVNKNTGMIMEVDMDTVSDYRKGFRTARGGLVFAFKEPDSLGGADGVTPAKLSQIKNKLATVESFLYTANRKRYYEQIDLQSAADFHLAVEYFKDIDSDFWRSKYFSWDPSGDTTSRNLRNGKLHFGPLWDFDKSIGNVDATNPGTAFTRSYRGWQANGTGVGKDNRVTFHTHWFVQLWNTSSFRNHLSKRWNNDDLRTEFWRAAKYDVEANQKELGWGAPNDRARWAGSAKLYAPKGKTYADEVRYVKSWLLNRFAWMDSQL